MRRLGRKIAAATGAAAACALMVGPASASAVTDYASSFATNANGWTSSTAYSNLTCILKPLTCPNVTNSFQASGGAGGAGDGFLRTSESALTGVAADANGFWESPLFTYNGDAGNGPTTLTFAFDYNEDLGALLDPNLGNSVRYSAFIIDTSGNAVLAPVNGQVVVPVSQWTTVGPIPLDISKLQLGHQYHVLLKTEFMTGVQVIPSGGVDYDNVDLRATFTPGAPTTFTLAVSNRGSGDGTVTSSPSGINCPDTCTSDFPSGASVTLTETPAAGSTFAGWGGACSGTASTCAVTMTQNRSVSARFTAPGGGGGGGGGGRGGPAFLHWHRLIVKTACPKSLHAHTCLIHLVTYRHGFSGVHPTLNKTVRRRGHHAKRISLRVRPRFNNWARSLARHHGRLHVHETLKAHHHEVARNTKLPTVAFKKP
jgi:hypothetical protein